MMKTIAVSGYFDPLHVGHIDYLELASRIEENARLIVIVNNDDQARLKKGKSFMPEGDRMRILGALRCVDEVCLSIDKDETVCETLRILKPDIFAKGGDRFSSEIPEAHICKAMDIAIVDGLGIKIRASSEFTGLK